MGTNDGGRPADWADREEAGTFAGWFVPSGSEIFMAVVLAAIVTAPAIAYPVFFAGPLSRNGVLVVIPLTWGLFAAVFWVRAVVILLRLVRFRIADGRLALQKSEFPFVGNVALPLADVVAVRAVSRAVAGKRVTYSVWDVVIEARDGSMHVVKLSRVVPDEAKWIARRVAAAAGVSASV